jgi:hypothetical protein
MASPLVPAAPCTADRLPRAWTKTLAPSRRLRLPSFKLLRGVVAAQSSGVSSGSCDWDSYVERLVNRADVRPCEIALIILVVARGLVEQ